MVIEDLVSILQVLFLECVGPNNYMQVQQIKSKMSNQLECQSQLQQWCCSLDSQQCGASELFWKLVKGGAGTHTAHDMLVSLPGSQTK